MTMPIAVQLYSLREELGKDFFGTLEQVAKIGYQGVEFAGYYGIDASQMKEALDSLGLVAAGSHVGINQLEKDIDAEINYCLEIGCKYLVIPWDQVNSRESAVNAAVRYRTWAEKCKENGLQLCYHNHSGELTLCDEELALDILYKELNAELLKVQVDTYWVQFAGVDPVAYIKKYPGRCPLIHQKDMKADESKGCTEIGNGIMNIAAIYKASEEVGAEWFIVEQDTWANSAIESVRICYENLKKMQLA